ncbi:MAG: FHA domain-containing protein [Solirubrobacterales bacterium]|nr:FHA domain-containing protein [Solirubrobacterales bacterium]
MDSRTPGEVEATGTLPVAGEGTLPLASAPGPVAPGRPDWIDEASSNVPEPGKYLAYEDSGRRIVVPVAREWTRIGRSLAADVRFDDSTVSRRHALIVAQADGVRVLDDRSLNGVYVNGRRVEWSPLADGDEIVVGRHTIHFMDTAPGEAVLPDAAPAALAE